LQEIINKIRNREPGILDKQVLLEHAVLIPLVLYNNKLSILFEVRSHCLNGQPGEICFPGGHAEKNDGSPQDTALRETGEELGVDRSDIDIWGPLDILITPHQLKIHSFVGFIKDVKKINPDRSEVEEVFYVPLEFFLNTTPAVSRVNVVLQPEADFPFHLIPNGRDYYWRRGQYPVYFYHYENYLIWGLTARMLHHFIDLIR